MLTRLALFRLGLAWARRRLDDETRAEIETHLELSPSGTSAPA